jgi:hypothetical protein
MCTVSNGNQSEVNPMARRSETLREESLQVTTSINAAIAIN